MARVSILTGPRAGIDDTTPPLVVLDFDGTVAVGDGPVLAYADAAFALLDATKAAAARTVLDGVLAGRDRRWPDPYVAVAELCSGVPAADLQAAYVASRDRLAREDLGVCVPDGLLAALDRWAGRAERVLVTNSPAHGTLQVLERLDLRRRFDRVVVDAGKPRRLAELLLVLLEGRSPDLLLSIGDHWPNDIAPALELGGHGGLIAPGPRADWPCDATAPTLTALLPYVDEWLAGARSPLTARSRA